MTGGFVQQIWELVFSFPTVVFTTMLVIALAYWALVMFGLFDFDFGADGMVDGALEGGAEGLVEGGVEGMVEGAAAGIEGGIEGGVEGVAAGLEGGLEGGIEAGAEGAAEAAGEATAEAADGALEGLQAGGFLSYLGVGKVPVTVVASFFTLSAWAVSILGAGYLLPHIPGPAIVGQLGLFAISVVAAAPLTRMCTLPMSPLFKVHHADSKRSLVGQTCRIYTGEVDEGFGQAVVGEGANEHMVMVRAPAGNGLKRGDEALIVAFDPAKDVFRIEALRIERPRRPGAAGRAPR